MKGIHVCSYCGAKYRGSDDDLVDGGWTRFELQMGRGECSDTKTRSCCTDPACKAMLHEDLLISLGGRSKAKAIKKQEEMM